MNEFEKNLVEKAFKRCFGLKTALKREDKLLRGAAIQSLAHQSGMRIKFIEENLKEIVL